MNRIRVVDLRPWRLAMLVLAASCAFVLADAGRAVDVPPGPATIPVEVMVATSACRPRASSSRSRAPTTARLRRSSEST
jgi:hypothetical protein